MSKEILPRATRIYIYQVVIAITPLLVAIGIMSEGIVQHILTVAAAILAIGSNGLALHNVPDAQH